MWRALSRKSVSKEDEVRVGGKYLALIGEGGRKDKCLEAFPILIIERKHGGMSGDDNGDPSVHPRLNRLSLDLSVGR